MNARLSLSVAALLVASLVSARSGSAAPEKKAPEKKAPDKKPPATKPADKSDRVGNIRFTRPSGWEMSEKEGIVILNPPGETPTDCSVILVSGEVLKDQDFLQWFKAKWKKLSQGVPAAQGGDVNVQEGKGGVEIIYQTALLEDKQKRSTGLLLYAARVGGEVEWAVFQTVGPKLFNQHNKAVSTMLASLKFERVESKPAAKKPPAGKGKADGGAR